MDDRRPGIDEKNESTSVWQWHRKVDPSQINTIGCCWDKKVFFQNGVSYSCTRKNEGGGKAIQWEGEGGMIRDSWHSWFLTSGIPDSVEVTTFYIPAIILLLMQKLCIHLASVKERKNPFYNPAASSSFCPPWTALAWRHSMRTMFHIYFDF